MEDSKLFMPRVGALGSDRGTVGATGAMGDVDGSDGDGVAFGQKYFPITFYPQ